METVLNSEHFKVHIPGL